MKKCFGLLLALLLMLTGNLTFAESAEGRQPGFYLYERRLVPTEEGCVLHLRILMVNDTAYCLDGVDVRLLDAQGQEIEPLSVRMEAPLNPVPAGETFFPVTLYYTLPEGREAADFQVTGIPGEAFDEPAAVQVSTKAGRILSATGQGPAVTAWMEIPDASKYYLDYMMVLYVYDHEDGYIGSLTLTKEDAADICPGSKAYSRLEEMSGLPAVVLDYYGISFDANKRYYLFDNILMKGVDAEDIPASAEIQVFQEKNPVRVIEASFQKRLDTWFVYCILQNAACEAYAPDNWHVVLYDADGNIGNFRTMSFGSYLIDEMDAFALWPFAAKVSGLPEGFVPVRAEIYTDGVYRAAQNKLKRLEDDCFELDMSLGAPYLSAVIPPELVPVSDMVFWYALNPEDGSFLSCGSCRGEQNDDALTVRPFRIENVPQGVTPSVAVFFINAK